MAPDLHDRGNGGAALMRRQTSSTQPASGEKQNQTIHLHDALDEEDHPDEPSHQPSGGEAPQMHGLSFIELQEDHTPPQTAHLNGVLVESFPDDGIAHVRLNTTFDEHLAAHLAALQAEDANSNVTAAGSFYADGASLLASAEAVASEQPELGWETISPSAGICQDEQTVMMYDETGFLNGLSHHRIECASNAYMSRWRFSRAGTANKLQVFYTCCILQETLGYCHEQGSKWTPEDAGRLDALTKHDVECRGNRALQRWHAEFNSITRSFRINYACCDLPYSQAFGGCIDQTTTKTALSSSTLDFTRHNVQCPTAYAMTRWRFVKSATQMWVQYTCCAVGRMVHLRKPQICSWVGDPHFRTFDKTRIDPVGPGRGLAYWVVRSRFISVQSYYQGLGESEPAFTRAVAVSGPFMRNNKLVIAKDVKYLTNTAPEYRKSMPTKILWNDKEVAVDGGFKTLGSGLVTIQKTGIQYRIHFPLGVSMRINAHDFYLDTFLRMGRPPGGQDGQCGSNNFNPGDDSKPRLQYNGSLAVNSSENLFMSDAQERPFQAGGRRLAECVGDKRSAAEKACWEAFKGTGIMRDFLTACVYDTCFSGSIPKVAENDVAAEQELRSMFELEKPRDIIVGEHARSYDEAVGVCASFPNYELYRIQSKVEHAAALQAISLRHWKVTEEVLTSGRFTNGKWRWADGVEICSTSFLSWTVGHGKEGVTPVNRNLCISKTTGLWMECKDGALMSVLCGRKKAYGAQGMTGPNGARVVCGLGKVLAMPKSQQENDALVAELKKDMSEGLAFLGGRFDASYGWIWDDGSAVCGFTNWDANEPNLGQKDTAMLWMCVNVANGKWRSCLNAPQQLVSCETAADNVRCPAPANRLSRSQATFCANGNGECTCTGTMFYGSFQFSVPLKFLKFAGFKDLPARAHIRCDDATFGDPHPSHAKFCYCQEPNSQDAMFCSKQSENCHCAGTAYYGAGNFASIEVKELTRSGNSFAKRPSSSSVVCNNGLFGDPAAGIHKSCLCQALNEITATFCAREGQRCTCIGMVWYGVARGRVNEFALQNNGYVRRVVTGSLTCRNTVFGDPHPGVHKYCYCQTSTFLNPTFCGKENEQCSCAGVVWYGGRFPNVSVTSLETNLFSQRVVGDTTKCGGNDWLDPKPGFNHACYCQEGATLGNMEDTKTDHALQHFMNHCYYLGAKNEDCHQTCARTVNGFCDNRGLSLAARSTEACRLIATGFGGLIRPNDKVSRILTQNARIGCSVVKMPTFTQVIVDAELAGRGTRRLGPSCGDASDNVNQQRICSCSTTEDYDYPVDHVMLPNDRIRVTGRGARPTEDFTVELSGTVLKAWMRPENETIMEQKGHGLLESVVNSDGSIRGNMDEEPTDEEPGQYYEPSLTEEDEEDVTDEQDEAEDDQQASLLGTAEEPDEEEDDRSEDESAKAAEASDVGEGEEVSGDNKKKNGNALSLVEETEDEEQEEDLIDQLPSASASASRPASTVERNGPRRRMITRRRRWFHAFELGFRRRFAGMLVKARFTAQVSKRRILWQSFRFGLWSKTRTVLAWPFSREHRSGESLPRRWSVDFQKTKRRWQLFVNGNRLPFGDFRAKANVAWKLVESKNIPSQKVVLFPPQYPDFSAPVSYYTDNGCMRFPYVFKSDVVTWEFAMNLDSTMGQRCLRCEARSTRFGNNVILDNGRLTVTINNNAPRLITFSRKFLPNKFYNITIVYDKAFKALQLYLAGSLVEEKYFSRAETADMTKAHIGCWYDWKVVVGTILNMRVLARHPDMAREHGFCNHFEGCRSGSVLRDDPENFMCKGRVCEHKADHDTCCAPLATCMAYTCPAGEERRTAAATVHCAGTTCQHTDRAKCCVKAKTCATMVCPSGFGHRLFPEDTFCDGALNGQEGVCTAAADLDKCCIQTHGCQTYACPVGFTAKAGMGKVSCKHFPCSKSDEAICCAKQGMCNAYQCPRGYTFRANAANIACEDPTCKETTFTKCCVEIGKCSSLPCPASMVPSSEVVKQDMYCSSLACTVQDYSRCCTPKATCLTYQCPFHLVRKPNAKTTLCTGSTCQAADTETCCTQKGRCNSFLCPFQYSLRSDAASILCADSGCVTTDFNRCCANNKNCDSYTCPTGMVQKVKASTIPCLADTCKAEDQQLCCDIQATCNSMICPIGTVQKAGAKDVRCKTPLCDRSDADTCCSPSGSCLTANCPMGYHLKADAKLRICKTASCDDSDYRHCCDKSNMCSTLTCPAAYVSRPDASRTTCGGSVCTVARDLTSCCEKRQACAGYGCPVGLVLKGDAASLQCAKELCNEGDAATCCLRPGFCTSFTCPVDYAPKPDAATVPCTDVACNKTDYTTCCIAEASCGTYTCPRNFVPHVGPPRNCSTWTCTDKDRDLCCVPLATCTSLTCPAGKVLRASPANFFCTGHQCTAADTDTCCENVGLCATYECPMPAWKHRADMDTRLCSDKACKDTDYRNCCAEARSCDTFKCPVPYIPRNQTGLRCMDTICTKQDLDICCDRREPCANFMCPVGMHQKKDSQALSCEGRYCSSTDTFTCCATKLHCDSMTCPVGFIHKADARTIPCDKVTCETTPVSKCCTQQSSCMGFQCPVPSYTPRADSDRVYCAGWTCSEVDIPVCCDHVADCRNMVCDDPLVLRSDPQKFACKSPFCSKEDEPMCCSEPGKCATFKCPSAYLHKRSADKIPCKTADCIMEEFDHCCVLKNVCETMSCPMNMVLRDQAHSLTCHGYACSDIDVHTCCVARTHCNTIECPLTLRHVEHPDTIMCANQTCTDGDFDVCCQGQDTCQNFECPMGWGLKDAAATIKCGESACLDIGYPHCCDKQATCEDYMCPRHLVEKTKVDLSKILCIGAECEPLCCDEKARCSSFACPEHYIAKAENFTFCSATECSEADIYQCCTLFDRCTSLSCPMGFAHRHNADELICADHLCTIADKDVCCVEETSCAAHKCPYGMAHHTNDMGEHGLCHDVPCSSEDDANCCGIAAMCSNLTCPSGFTSRSHASFIFCENMECDPVIDLQTCCADSSNCGGFDCQTEIMGLTHRWDAHEIACGGPHCSDACCVQADSCTAFSCPAGFARKPFSSGITCDKTCSEKDVSTCCLEDGKCPSLMCPPDYVPKEGYLQLHCLGQTCTGDDVPVCCERRALCGTLQCPDQTEHIENSTLCAGSICNEYVDSARCCSPRGLCSENAQMFMCPVEKTLARGKDAYCAGQVCQEEDTARCCIDRQQCTTWTCPAGWRTQENAVKYVTSCNYDHCTVEEDLRTCCEPGDETRAGLRNPR